jgi:hypothetical protein
MSCVPRQVEVFSYFCERIEDLLARVGENCPFSAMLKTGGSREQIHLRRVIPLQQFRPCVMTNHFFFRRCRALLLLMTLFIGSAFAADDGKSSVYKWTDDRGNIHYSDKQPTNDGAKAAKTVLDNQGRQRGKIESAAEFKARKQKEKEAATVKPVDPQEKSRQDYDRALLASYFSENDFDVARERAVDELDARISATTTLLTDLQTRNTELQQRLQQGERVSDETFQSVKKDITLQKGNLGLLYTERQKVLDKYAADKKRWKELTKN